MTQKMLFGGVEIAQPSEVKFGNEKIWSNNAGRSSNCVMVGDIRAIKKTISLTWYHLDPQQIRQINSFISNIGRAFFQVTLLDDEFEYRTYNVYAGTPTYEIWGWDESRQFCKGLSVGLIEQ